VSTLAGLGGLRAWLISTCFHPCCLFEEWNSAREALDPTEKRPEARYAVEQLSAPLSGGRSDPFDEVEVDARPAAAAEKEEPSCDLTDR
jgi:hypothetical protein